MVGEVDTLVFKSVGCQPVGFLIAVNPPVGWNPEERYYISGINKMGYGVSDLEQKGNVTARGWRLYGNNGRERVRHD